MKIRFAQILGVSAVVVSMGAASAHAAVGVSLVGAGNFSSPSYTLLDGTSLTTSAKLGVGGGALFDFNLGARTGLELGALYVQDKYSYTIAGTETTLTTKTYIAPVTLWLKATSHFWLGFGGFYQHVPKTADYKQTTAGVSTTGTADTGLTATNYGASAGVKFMFPVGGRTSLLVDGRYLMGLKDLDATTAKYSSRSILALAGLRFAL